MNGRRVVITGLGVITSLGKDVDTYWSALVAGKSGIGPITRFDITDYTTKFGGEISDWNGSPYLEPRDLKRLDRFAQFGLAASIGAVRDAGLDLEQEDPYRCGTIIGSGIGGIEEFEVGYKKLLEKGPSRVSPFMVPKLMINAASANVSIYYGIKGTNSASVTACASAGHAIADAMKAIQRDEADVMVTGGSEAALTALGTACFMTLKALSTRNDDPQRASRPFDKDRDGFVLSEGAGILVLEEYEHARRRGAKIYGELLGYGMTADGSHITAPDPEGAGAREAMRRAISMAGLELTDMDHINPHATSTSLGDLAENAAIKSLFGDHAGKMAISATKSMTGHLLGASGGIEMVAVCKALETGVMPPTINLENPDEGCDLNYVANQPQERQIRFGMSNSFGFGGHNVSLVVGKI